jgi:hypothetical protein
MTDDSWIDDFIQEVKKLAYDIPPPNPYTAMLLSHCVEAERHLLKERYAIEDAKFKAFCGHLAGIMIKSEPSGHHL